MEDYYAPVLANLTNATSASAWCDNYNYTAVVVTRANYYATDTIFRSEGDDVRSVADRVRRVVYDAAVATRRLRRRIKQRIRAKAGGSASRRLASSSSISGGGGGGYAYNATSAIQFVDAATTLNVSTFVVGTIGPTGVPTSAPSSAPTGLPTPAPTTLPSPAPTELPSAVPTFLPTPVPTPACPTWATSRDCGDDCLCCTAYNNNNNTNNNGTAQQQQQQKDGKKNCLACHAGYDCLDVDGDGDGECEWNATFAPGNNLCDWWLWAWYYGPPVPGRDTPNGHDYADDFTLDKDFYVIGGQNCSVDRVEIISTSAAGRTFDEDGDGEDDYHACNGLFAFGNDTRYASGSADHDHDREASVCYKDYRDPDYRGYCSYMVGPSACARCNPYSSNDLVVANTLSLSVASGQTVAELNADVDFKLALRTTIFYSSGLDAYAKLTAEPYTYVQDLEFVEQSSLRRRLLSSVDALYNIVVSASSVTVSASDFYDDVQATAEAAVSSGAFGTTLTTYLATYNIAANYTVNVTAIYAEVLQTVPPTYWSLTADNIVPPVILNRIGGAFSHHSSLPACGCADL
ncbi:hypothetical protein CTAYLR_008788 [Chrysophaeum taylorii]|uniref:Uncharacterized protein n=1 Tax=Chrysophaeum taylorii TaxID=2483200 RepID=A0AAD7XRX8_9STRA|nr:hypothetical protein CTAYLR_008788 [Chrysophaeum taylorii]